MFNRDILKTKLVCKYVLQSRGHLTRYIIFFMYLQPTSFGFDKFFEMWVEYCCIKRLRAMKSEIDETYQKYEVTQDQNVLLHDSLLVLSVYSDLSGRLKRSKKCEKMICENDTSLWYVITVKVYILFICNSVFRRQYISRVLYPFQSYTFHFLTSQILFF